MKEYTYAEKDAIGREIAGILMLKIKRPHKKGDARYLTTWGDKTNVGIFETVLRFAEEINSRTALDNIK